MNNNNIIDDDLATEKIQAALRKLKPGKASGIDGLQSEHLMYGCPLLLLWLRQLGIQCLNSFVSHLTSEFSILHRIKSIVYVYLLLYSPIGTRGK